MTIRNTAQYLSIRRWKWLTGNGKLLKLNKSIYRFVATQILLR